MATLNELFQDKGRIEEMLIESGGELTPEIEEMMQVNETNIANKIDSYHSLIVAMDYGTAEIDKEIKRLQTLKTTKQNAVKSLKNRLFWLMKQAGLQSINGTLCKAYLRSNSPSVVIDENVLASWDKYVSDNISIPDWVKVTVSIDKTALKEALKTEEIGGVSLESTECVVIK